MQAIQTLGEFSNVAQVGIFFLKYFTLTVSTNPSWNLLNHVRLQRSDTRKAIDKPPIIFRKSTIYSLCTCTILKQQFLFACEEERNKKALGTMR